MPEIGVRTFFIFTSTHFFLSYSTFYFLFFIYLALPFLIFYLFKTDAFADANPWFDRGMNSFLTKIQENGQTLPFRDGLTRLFDIEARKLGEAAVKSIRDNSYGRVLKTIEAMVRVGVPNEALGLAGIYIIFIFLHHSIHNQ